MNSYGGLAAVYDYMVAGVDFADWIAYVEKLLDHYGYYPGSVLDLACGTGNTLIPFAMKGYSARGVDISREMIAVARGKTSELGLDIEYSVGDIIDFLVGKPVELVTCFHDGLNYITERDHLKKVFENTAKNLVEGGMFVFDLNAVKWIGTVDDRPVVIDEDNMTIIYESEHHTRDSVWTVKITCFVKEGDLYRKFTETHREKGYEVEEIEKMLVEAGFSPLAVYDAFSFNPPHPKSKRHFYVARKS